MLIGILAAIGGAIIGLIIGYYMMKPKTQTAAISVTAPTV